MNPFCTIIVPVYNAEEWIRECLDSIKAQTIGAWECVCVDDGSTDSSRFTLEEYAAKDERIKVLRQKNSGVSEARNAGLAAAIGDYVWFVDGDDCINKYALEYAKKCFDIYPNASGLFFEYSDSQSCVEDDVVERAPNSNFKTGFTGKLARAYLNPACRFIIRRSDLVGIRFKPYKYNEDALFMMTACWKSAGLIISSETLYFYRLHGGSATHKTLGEDEVSKIFKSEQEIFDLADSHRALWDGNDMSEFWSFFHSRVYGTYYGSYFKLPVKSRMRLFPQWRHLQEGCMREYSVPLGRRIRCKLAFLLNSGLFVKLCVYGFASSFGVIRLVLSRLGKR